MADYKQLLELIEKRNIAEDLDDERRREIAEQVVRGHEIDSDSRSEWLAINERAMDIIHMSGDVAQDRDSPFEKSSKIIYPLIAPAIIHSSARLVPHFRRNNEAVTLAASGDDPMGLLKTRIDRLRKHMNWELLVNNNGAWMLRNHKLANILTSWGIVFRKTYYDVVEDTVLDDLIHPRDVVINEGAQTLKDADRITLINYLNINDILTQVNMGNFNSDLSEMSLSNKTNAESLGTSNNEYKENDSRDDQPTYEVLEQYCYLDLDEDGYYEPYVAFVHSESSSLLGLFCAYQNEDIIFDKTLNFIGITRRLPITDYHYIDDPNGGYYSIGLNHLLLNLSDAATALLRNQIDSATMSNYQGGFITKAFKTKERTLEFNKLGQWKVLETGPDTDLRKAILPLPTKESSPVLFQLLGLIIEAGKEVGFITDILTGDQPAQNVPATTMLAMVEQGTRAFKPIVEKLYYSMSAEFHIRMELSKNISNERYQKFHNNQEVNIVQDYELDSLDIKPVADPTLSSEAHKYAKMQAMMQTMEFVPNKLELLKRFYTELEVENLEALFESPGQPAPDPKIMKAMAEIQLQEKELQLQEKGIKIKEMAEQRAMLEVKIKELVAKNKTMETMIKKSESAAKIKKMQADAIKDQIDAGLAERNTRVQEEGNEIERDRIRSMEAISRNKANTD